MTVRDTVLLSDTVPNNGRPLLVYNTGQSVGGLTQFVGALATRHRQPPTVHKELARSRHGFPRYQRSIRSGPPQRDGDPLENQLCPVRIGPDEQATAGQFHRDWNR